MSIADKYRALYNKLQAQHIQLIAVSKTKPIDEIQQVYDAGCRQFGENHAQELIEKAPALPLDIQWHFIGHLQTNKVKAIIPYTSLIHSVDSMRLAAEINKQAAKHKKVQDCLLQVYIADEETKYGLDFAECIELLRNPDFKALTNIRVCGLMAIASNTKNERQLNAEFHELNVFFQGIKESFYKNDIAFSIISAGMSSDYQLAIANGANMVRLGSTIFGKRSYPTTPNPSLN